MADNRIDDPVPFTIVGPPSAPLGDGSVAMDRIRQGRDFYQKVLRLGSSEKIEALLEQALALVVELTGARQGYLEIVDPLGPDSACWSLSHGCTGEEFDSIREKISRGIIAEAMASKRIITTSSAHLDPRFNQNESVRVGRIDAVLCAPVGKEMPAGVIYLQGRREPGAFDAEDVADIELFAQQLFLVADRLLTEHRARSANDATSELREQYHLDNIVGASPALANVLRESMLAARTSVSMLITGESGTGKTQLAKAIHLNSSRASEPFVELNCATIQSSLAEAELFGAARGAYTGAHRDVAGRIESAAGGTLFLDEIGELPLDTQAKLLQFLQSGEYRRLGEDTVRLSSARVISATNDDLAASVKSGRFREDLLFRVNAFAVRMPSLEERRQDIPLLAEYLCERLCRQHGLPPTELSVSALSALVNVELPGNVRQLENLIAAGVIRAAGMNARSVQINHLFRDATGQPAEDEPSFAEATRRFQRDLVAKTLADTSWNVTEAARRLDIARSYAYNLIKAFGLQRES